LDQPQILEVIQMLGAFVARVAEAARDEVLLEAGMLGQMEKLWLMKVEQ
jgi:hypothetical protein